MRINRGDASRRPLSHRHDQQGECMRHLRFRTMAAAAAVAALAACSDDTTQPTELGTPTGVTVAQLSLTSVRVTWNAVTDAERYIVERSDAAAPGVFTVRDTVAATQFDDTG